MRTLEKRLGKLEEKTGDNLPIFIVWRTWLETKEQAVVNAGYTMEQLETDKRTFNFMEIRAVRPDRSIVELGEEMP